ncbi:MAG: heparin lyase I family protein [Pseudomonadota bacterium]
MLRFAVILAIWPVALPAAGRGTFGPFVRSLNDTPHGYADVPAPTPMAPTAMVERFELRPGDCGSHRGWSDCRTDRERSELSELGPRSRAGEVAWYGWWVHLPPDWPDVWPAKTTIAQFHQEDSHPVWMFLHKGGALVIDNQSTGRTTETVPIIAPEALRGRWHRIEVFARWSRGSDGQFAVYVNGDLRFAHEGPTMTARKVYFRYGVYRSFVSRHDGPAPTQIAYFAAVRKARDRAALAIQ